uniref:protein TASOR 2 isoform X2 n=1 Tax=Semicossyphus pulcher TaxID=241346 RepID=UPI0037E81E95
MESGNGGASSKGDLVPVPENSEAFHNNILAPLKSAYLYEESKQSFRYKSAFLVKNPALEEKYNAFRAKRREAGYSEEDLKESYGFLLFEDVDKANTLGETGVLSGNSTCTTLGDPSNGVYISMYSDCLDLNRWYHGKSGYIAIIRLTKGRVKKVLENYTQTLTVPTVGFDCHVSEQLSSVSANTSSFLAFERTQYYMYELLDDGSKEAAKSPSAACPFAIVAFSYTDTKATLVAPQEKSEEKKQVCHYIPWRGQLQIGTQSYEVGLRSASGAMIPAELPPVVKIDKAISMLDLRQLLPRVVFETCFSGEVFLDGLFGSLCEFVSTEVEETNSLSLLLCEVKEKDIALIIPLNDGGFLILMHSSNFLSYDETGSSTSDVFQGVFVFPDSRVVQRGTKFGQRKPTISPEILRVLPVLSYAEGEVEKSHVDPSEELCEVLAQHMQSYAALINPGLELSPSKEVSIFPDQYDVPDAHKHLYTSPEWTNKAWQSLESYLSKPVSFQLPLAKASEILVVGPENRIEDLDDDVYICLSSPEEAPANVADTCSEDQLTGPKSSVNVETSLDSCMSSVEAPLDSRDGPQNVLPDDLQAGGSDKETEKPELSVLIKTDIMRTKNLLIPSTSDELPAELIVSITSAERTDGTVISTESATKLNDFQIPDLSTAKIQTAGVNPLNDETIRTKKLLDSPEVNKLKKTKRRKVRRGHFRRRKKVSNAGVDPPSLPAVQIPVECENLKSQKDDLAKESVNHPLLSKPSITDWKTVRRRKRIFGKLSSKHKKVSSCPVGLALTEEIKTDSEQQKLESTILTELEACPPRKKIERWDLKPVVSECGRILVPHGSVDIADKIKPLKDTLQSTKNQQCLENMLVVASEEAHNTVKMAEKSSTAPETAVDTVETTTLKDGVNLKNVTVSNVYPEHCILRPSDAGNDNSNVNLESSEHSSKNDCTDTSPLEAAQEKHSDTPAPAKCSTKGEILLSKLKSVLLKGKRKSLESEERTAGTAQDTEPCLKMNKVDSVTGVLKSSDAITSVQDNNLGLKEVSRMLSVDPLFAYALGLTPKEKTNSLSSQQRTDTSQTKEQPIFDKQPEIILKPPSIFPRRGRIKTLKKHQDISTENVKKKCTPFQVSPLSGCTGLLHHQKTMYDDGNGTLLPSVVEEDRSEQDCRTPDLKKHMMRRRKFRHSRTFVNKDGSVQVTKEWKENYDFNLDSKFTSDSQDKAITRALHGPWDYSVQDTSEEVRLIVHMWIGLFYSRSTARFFHIDSNLTYPCSEESDFLKKANGITSGSVQSELKANSDASFPSVPDTSDSSPSNALDLSKKGDSVLDQGSVILDLSLKNSSAKVINSDPQVNRKETSVSGDREEARKTLKTQSSEGLQEASPSQSHKEIKSSTKIITEVNDVRSTFEKQKPCTPSQKSGKVEHTHVSTPKDGALIPVQKMTESVSTQPENNQTSSVIADMLSGCNNEKTDTKDGTGNSEAMEINLVQQHERDSSKSMMDDEVDSNKEASEVVHKVQHDEIEPKNEENSKVKEEPLKEGNVQPKMMQTDDSTNEESGLVCNENLLENEKQFSSEEPMAISQDKAENVIEDVDCCADDESKVIKDDPFEKEDRPGDKDSCVSALETDGDVGNQPLSVMCDGPNSVKNDSITKYNCQAKLDEPPPQADKKQDFNDLQLRELSENDNVLECGNTISEKDPCTPSKSTAILNEPAIEEKSENGICFANKADKNDRTCSLDRSNADEPIPKTIECIETGIQNEEMSSVSLKSVHEVHEDCDTKSVEGEQNGDNQTPNELSNHQSHSLWCEQMKSGTEVALTTETDPMKSKTNKELEKIHSRVVIPFIGIDISQEDTVLIHDSDSGKVEEIAQGQKEIPSICKTSYPESVKPIEVCSTSPMYSKKAELSSGKISLLGVPKTNQLVVSGSESDDRCPTPTMDERPYESLASSGPGSCTSAFSGSETCKSMTKTCLSRSSKSRKDEMLTEQRPRQKSTVSGHPSSHHGLRPDLEQRTLRVLQSINKFFYESSHTNKSSQMEAANMKHSLGKAPNPSINHILTDFKDQKISNTKSASNVQEGESSRDFPISPFKSKREEVLGVGFQFKKTDQSVHQHSTERKDKLQETSFRQDYCHPNRSPPSSECLGAIGRGRDTTTSQANLSHEPRSHNQRPIMAVKPSKSDETQADCVSKDSKMEISNFPKYIQNKNPIVTSTTPTTMLFEKKTDCHKGSSERLKDDWQEAAELSKKSSWLSYVTDNKSKKAKFACRDALYQYKGSDISKFNKTSSSSLPGQPLVSTKSSSQLVDEKQGFLTNHLAEKVRQTAKESLEMDQKGCSGASTSHVDYRDDDKIDDSLYLGPESSLTCTVYNTSRKRSYSLLEQLSHRCLQDDPTEASMEQECLIFSEKMKQLLKRSKRGSIRQPVAHDKLNLFCPSPVMVHFSGLEEQEDSEDHLDAQTLLGRKFKVDMSDREELAIKEERNSHSQKSSQGTGASIEHAGVSSVTAECAVLYDEMMNDVCAVRKVPSKLDRFRMDRADPNTEPSNYFDFFDQMKKEMDESFRSNLNSLVKKSCKTKYRFYVLMTSDDGFFEETKALLEAEGHTAVEPSEFFLGESSPSSLLIILRNEDIAEHICEVPHLLELKKSPGVQFAGIDEPDDVVNLTHQELFTRGGFIMFDRAALEPLSLCNMKKMSEVLQEQSKTGKWKWMLHYRDSRRLKENARLSAEAKEKKNLLNWCQEAGILEVLPYHECDLMSRDQPDYLTCLVRLQVQNISARYTVFITDTTTDSAFASNGILTTTFNSFMTCSPSEAFPV